SPPPTAQKLSKPSRPRSRDRSVGEAAWPRGHAVAVCSGAPWGDGEGAEGVHEQVAAHRQAIPRPPRLHARHVRVEQRHPFVRLLRPGEQGGGEPEAPWSCTRFAKFQTLEDRRGEGQPKLSRASGPRPVKASFPRFQAAAESGPAWR